MEFIKELEQLPNEVQDKINAGLQRQIIEQAEFIKREMPDRYLSYLDEEIGKAEASMLRMVNESNNDGAILPTISEIYIWNKERKRTLCRLKDAFIKEYGEAFYEPQQPTLPKELDNDEAAKYFAKAIEIGLMDESYNWSKGMQLLSCFAREMSLKLGLSEAQNSDGTQRISWQPFEQLFKIDKGKLRSNYNDIQKTGQNPHGIELIDKIFE